MVYGLTQNSSICSRVKDLDQISLPPLVLRMNPAARALVLTRMLELNETCAWFVLTLKIRLGRRIFPETPLPGCGLPGSDRPHQTQYQ